MIVIIIYDYSTITPFYKMVAIINWTSKICYNITIKNMGNIYNYFRKSVLWNGCTYWSKLWFFLFFTCSYNCLLSNKVWGEENFFNGHEEHFRVLYATNELLEWNYKRKFLKTKCWNTGKLNGRGKINPLHMV